MSKSTAIEINNLTKIYRLYNSPKDRLREMISLTGRKLHHEFHALNDVSFSIEKGQTVGIIGKNGSGKSTLLKIICGVLQPSSGGVKVNGRISSLLELGAGFNPEFTGRENVYMNGALMGFSREAMESRFPEIEAFADIGEYIDQPTKSYSSGMLVRLAFAAANTVDPDILIVDEALSVGDVWFQTKCFSRFQELKDRKVTILFVTHDLRLVSTHCDYGLLLDKGALVLRGMPKVVIERYHEITTTREKTKPISDTPNSNLYMEYSNAILSLNYKTEWQDMFQINPTEYRYGSKDVEILEAGIFSTDNVPVQVVDRNQEYYIKVKVLYKDNMPAVYVSYAIKDTKGIVLCGTNTYFHHIEIGQMEKGQVVMVVFRQIIRLNQGDYLLSVGCDALVQGEWIALDRRVDHLAFKVVGSERRIGLFDLDPKIEWVRC